MADTRKRGYLLENFRLFHLKSKGGTQVEYHYHEFCKILLLVQGSGGYFIDGQRYLLQSGDILLLDAHSIHRPELDPEAPYERIILYISPEYLQRQSTQDCNLRSVFSGEKGHVLRLTEERKQTVFRIAAALEKELSSEAFGREILSNAGLLRLLVEIGRNRENPAADRPSPLMPKDPRILGILQYIDEHISEDLDAEVIAKTFFVSKYHLMRQFRRETGTTIHLYITQKRLVKAKELMDSGMRATEACYRCGWRSYSSFTRAYGKHLGTTPTGRLDKTSARDADFE
jgi:AraC-like DNA-binding protein